MNCDMTIPWILLLSNKILKNTIDTYNYLDKSPENYASEKSKSRKGISYMIPFIEHFGNDKVIEIEDRLMKADVKERKDWRVRGLWMWYKKAPWGILEVI